MGPFLGATAALATMVVSLLFWVSSSYPLRDLVVSHTSREMQHVWPVVIYGPWLVAFLSSLLGTFERSRIAHSWVVVVLFSAAATSLCSKSLLGVPTEIIVAGLPPVAAAISFHQFMSQVSVLRFPVGRRMHARSS